jgi:hypothetical protein
MIKFPSIDQFRTVVSNINRHYNFVGLDESSEAIYDHTLPKPTLTFTGKVKLHGTNAAVSLTKMDIGHNLVKTLLHQKKIMLGLFFVESKRCI